MDRWMDAYIYTSTRSFFESNKTMFHHSKYVKQLGWKEDNRRHHWLNAFYLSSSCTLSSFFLICNSSNEYLTKFVVFYSMFVGLTTHWKIHQNHVLLFHFILFYATFFFLCQKMKDFIKFLWISFKAWSKLIKIDELTQTDRLYVFSRLYWFSFHFN